METVTSWIKRGLHRRQFVRYSLLVLASVFSGRLLARSQGNEIFAPLEDRLSGKLTLRGDNSYEIKRQSLIWQLRKPQQYPAAIVEALNIEDVQTVVRFAADHGYRVATRCGGHSYTASFLQDNVIILDIGRLRELSIDAKNHSAKVQSAVRSVDLMARLEEEGMAFPAAHCGNVPVGGFLLGGGLGWNGEEWNAMSCFNVTEVEVVTAAGEYIIANNTLNSDYYWAARGAGPCFFGVVISYSLKLYPAPRSILTSTYIWPMSSAKEASRWANDQAALLPENVEILFIMTKAPDTMLNDCAQNEKVCILQASAFAESDASARAALKPLEDLEEILNTKCLLRDEYASTPISALYEWDATAYPQWRWAVDCLWTDDAPEELVGDIARYIDQMPSPKSSVLLLFKPRSSELPEPAAFSLIGKTYAACYAIWGSPQEDKANIDWVNKIMQAAEPYTKGHYINESDYVAKPSRIRNSFSEAAWIKLNALSQKHDPKKLFHTSISES